MVNEENRIGREKRWAREGDRRPNTLLGAPRMQRPAWASKGERVVYSLPKPLGQTARSLAPVEFEAYIPVLAGDLLSLRPRRGQKGPPWPWLSDASRSSTGGRPWSRPRADIAIGITACSSLMLPLRAALTARAGLPMEGPVPERSLNAPLQAPAAAGTEKSRSLSAYQWAMLLARLYESQVLGMGLLGAPMRIIAFVTDVGLRGFHSAYPRLPRRARPGSAHLSSARIFWTHAATGTST